MKVVKASLAVPGDTGRIIYVSLAEAILLKALLRAVSGGGASLKSTAIIMASQFGESDVYLNGPELFTSYLSCAENSVSRLQENVDEN